MDKYWWVLPALFVVIVFVAIIGVNQATNQMTEEYRIQREWTHKCIDAGGVPVNVFVYVKGLGQGNRCVTHVEIVEVK